MSTELEVMSKVEAIRHDRTSFIQANQSLEIMNDEQMNQASEVLLAIKKRIKRIKEIETEYVKPLKDQVKKITELFSGERKELERFAEHIQYLTSAFFAEQERLRIEAERQARMEYERQKAAAEAEQERLKIEAEKEAAEIAAQAGVPAEAVTVIVPEPQFVPEPPKIQAAQTKATTNSGTVFARKVWDFEITDESQIPREFLCVDTKKIREAISGGERQIEGVRIFQKILTGTRS